MAIYQRSILGWIIGGAIGGIAGLVSARSRRRNPLSDTLLGIVGGSIVVGAVNDKRLKSR